MTTQKRILGRPGQPSRFGRSFSVMLLRWFLMRAGRVAMLPGRLALMMGPNWVSKERARRTVGADLSIDERAELGELRRQVGELRNSNDRWLLGQGVGTVKRFECVDAQKAAGSAVTAACTAAEVSTSGY